MANILAIDDNPVMLCTLSLLLEAWGHAVVIASSTREAVARVGAGSIPDAIVSDFELKDGDSGLAAIDAVAGKIGKTVPSVIVTANADAPSLRENTWPVVRKPYAEVDLRSWLESALH